MSIFFEPHCPKCKDWCPIDRWHCPNWIKETIAKHPDESADWKRRARRAQKVYDAEMLAIRLEAKTLYAQERVYPVFSGSDIFIWSTPLDDQMHDLERKQEALK